MDYVEQELGVPLHLQFAISRLAREKGPGVWGAGAPPTESAQRVNEVVPRSAFDSIPFYSLCRAIFLPLSGLAPEKVAQLFGIPVAEPPDSAGREKLLHDFVAKPIGLS